MSSVPLDESTSMDSVQVMATLPHRYPMLMIDRVLNMSKDLIVAIKAVSSCDPYFQGHFPDFPIMPGVLILEGMAQASVILAKRRLSETMDAHALNGLLISVERAKFRKPVVPGDLLEFRCSILQLRGSTFKCSCLAMVGDALVSEAIVSGTIMK